MPRRGRPRHRAVPRTRDERLDVKKARPFAERDRHLREMPMAELIERQAARSNILGDQS